MPDEVKFPLFPLEKNKSPFLWTHWPLIPAFWIISEIAKNTKEGIVGITVSKNTKLIIVIVLFWEILI